MHVLLKTFAGVIALAAGSLSASAADHVDHGAHDLVQMRSGAQGMAANNRENYCSQMQSKIQSMSSEERELYGNRMVVAVERRILMARILATATAPSKATAGALPVRDKEVVKSQVVMVPVVVQRATIMNNKIWLSGVCSKDTGKTPEKIVLPALSRIYPV